MATRMLIDARHPEETRVAVLKGNRIEEFDFESADHRQIKGNIYLAKVTRVEPSLQAAFVDFGGNRHGFLAFSEIHPDYYQIPQQDREALLAEEQAHAEEEAALRALDEDGDDGDGGEHDADESDEDTSGVEEIDSDEADQVSTIEDGHVENGDDDNDAEEDDASDETSGDDADADGSGTSGDGRRRRGRRQGRGSGGSADSKARAKEMDDLRARRMALRRRYKIQDVIQRRQVLLVQVVKEERGNKGAALTTYLSLAGRYCVLMPNSSHGGGISRKISSAGDRKRLKQIVAELSLPRSMGLIVRTAGLQRNKTEIKRDFDYLARLWDEIRENTLGSTAPALIHSDSDLIKRAIRDIYNREIEEVVVEGEEAYRSARAFMKLLMPSHVRRVKAYSDPVPLFQRHGAEDQLSAMYDPVVQLKSGGYLVINPTEALVSIDINSGRSTKEHGIEQTALATNLEAAREIARQLRLRDMAGLVVIDFIDMEYGSNVRKVEKAMKDALKNDRARIQVGRISGFGLMEMSRQRLRTGVLEATTRSCPHCDGTGLVRTASSAGLSALRLIEDEAAKGKGTQITLYASTEATIYLLNSKRADLVEIEGRYGVTVEIVPEGENEGSKMRVASSGPRPAAVPRFEPIAEEVEQLDDLSGDESDDEDGEDAAQSADASDADDSADSSPSDNGDGENGDGRRKRRRRRRGGRNRNRNREGDEGSADEDTAGEDSVDSQDAESADSEEPEHPETATEAVVEDEAEQGADGEQAGEAQSPSETPPATTRRRRSRGGRSRRDDTAATTDEAAPEAGAGEEVSAAEAPPTQLDEDIARASATSASDAPAAVTGEAPDAQQEAEPEAKPKPRTRRRKADAPASENESTDETTAAPKPRTRRRKVAEPETVTATPEAAEAESGAAAEPVAEEPAPKPRRTRRKKTDTPSEEAAGGPSATGAEEVSPGSNDTPVSPADSAAGSDAPAQPEPEPVTADDEGAGDSAGTTGTPRRGWWQRTFGG